MARGFGTTYGTATSDRIVPASTINLTTVSSFSAWLWINGAGGNNAGRLLGDSNNGSLISMNGSTSQMVFTAIFTSAPGQWTWTPAATGAWQHLLITYDGSSVSNDPIVYVNGSPVSTNEALTPNGSFDTTKTLQAIGNRTSDNARVWDGMLAEVTRWSAVLSATEASALAKRVPVFFVRPTSLNLYAPLYGLQTNEQDWGPNRYGLSVTGALRRNHAPTTLWTPTSTSYPQYDEAIQTGFLKLVGYGGAVGQTGGLVA